MIEYGDTTFRVGTSANHTLRFVVPEHTNRCLPERREPHDPPVHTNSVRFPRAGTNFRPFSVDADSPGFDPAFNFAPRTEAATRENFLYFLCIQLMHGKKREIFPMTYQTSSRQASWALKLNSAPRQPLSILPSPPAMPPRPRPLPTRPRPRLPRKDPPECYAWIVCPRAGEVRQDS